MPAQDCKTARMKVRKEKSKGKRRAKEERSDQDEVHV